MCSRVVDAIHRFCRACIAAGNGCYATQMQMLTVGHLSEEQVRISLLSFSLISPAAHWIRMLVHSGDETRGIRGETAANRGPRPPAWQRARPSPN